MRIVFEQDGSPQALARVLAQFEIDVEVEGILILACDENGYTPANVDAILRATHKPLFGGVFPQIVHGQAHHSRGFIALGLCALPRVALIEDISHADKDFDEILADVFPKIDAQAKTLFVFVDGFASRINALIDGLFNSFGLEINYLGGGCGSLSLKAKPCIISNKGLMQDGAVLALLDLPSGIGVAHGWQPISDAYKVTESSGNIIHSLDWQPAYQVYRNLVEAHSRQQFRPDHFFPIAKAYPFGITKLGTEMIVRDPLMTLGESLVCVGEVPQGAYVRILNGDKSSLLAAAAQARGMASTAMDTHPAHMQICIDCISRVLFLEDQFHLELEALQDVALPMFGALTIGEIANSGREYLEFYNKTAVLGLI
ncbi:MAG: FIST N-terminal domain-containing protein [Gallionella sp.]